MAACNCKCGKAMHKVALNQLVSEMVREDLKTAERDDLVKKHGYKSKAITNNCPLVTR